MKKVILVSMLAGLVFAATQNFKALMPPPIMLAGNGGFETSTLLVDATGEMCGCVLRVPKTGNLWKVGFRTATVVQAQTIQVSFQNVDANGFPDETADQFRDISIADTDDSVWKLTGIISSDGTDGGTKRAVTQGDVVSVVFVHNTFNAGDVFRLTAWNTGLGASNFPNAVLKSGAPAWAKNTLRCNLVLLYDDGLAYYMPSVTPFSATTSESYSTGERGMRFQVPMPTKMSGVVVGPSSIGADLNINLYDSDETSVLHTMTIDKDLLAANNGFNLIWFSSDIALAKLTNYYLCLAPATAATISWVSGTVDQAAYLDQLAGGQLWPFISRATAGSGAFSVTATKTPIILTPIFSAFDDGVSAGGAAMPMVISQ